MSGTVDARGVRFVGGNALSIRWSDGAVGHTNRARHEDTGSVEPRDPAVVGARGNAARNRQTHDRRV